MNKLAFLGIALLILGCSPAEMGEVCIIPAPQKITLHKGFMRIKGTLQITVSDSALVPAAEVFRSALAQYLSVPSEVNGRGVLALSIDSSVLSPEGYKLAIGDGKISVKARTQQGALYGLQSLLQMMAQGKNNKGKLLLPYCDIEDSPRFGYRGMHLDVSRHFYPVEFIKKYISILSLYKINTFHWHLTDDQGWRIEIKKHPRLTEIGAWRKGNGMEDWNYFIDLPEPGGEKYGGYYTQKEIREIVTFAQERGITIVPEIEMPGHSWAVLAAYPELSCTGKRFYKPADVAWEFTDPYCAGNEATFALLEDALDEVIALFPGKYIHIGGDEAKKTPWETCPKCRKRMKESGLQHVEELQSYFIARIEKYLNEKGKSIIGWDEILEGGLAPNATVMSWRGEAGGIEAAQSGHDAIMTPSEYLYFNEEQEMAVNGPMESGGYLPLEKVYHYEPVPSALNDSLHRHIIGVQACAWSENMKTTGQVEEKLLPRLCALAEIAWSDPAAKDFGDFRKRLGAHYALWDRMELNYHLPFVGGLQKEMKFISNCRVEMFNPISIGRIHYTTDGTDPGLNASVYRQPLNLQEDVILKAGIILPSGKSGPVAQVRCIRVVPLKALSDTVKLNPGIDYKYFEATLNSLDEISKLKYLKTGTMEKPEIPAWAREDCWAIEFSGFLKVDSTAVYRFYTASDDGSRIIIDGERIVDNDGIHGVEISTGQIALEKGFHAITLQYFEGNYGQHFEAGFINGRGERIPFSDQFYY